MFQLFQTPAQGTLCSTFLLPSNVTVLCLRGGFAQLSSDDCSQYTITEQNAVPYCCQWSQGRPYLLSPQCWRLSVGLSTLESPPGTLRRWSECGIGQRIGMGWYPKKGVDLNILEGFWTVMAQRPEMKVARAVSWGRSRALTIVVDRANWEKPQSRPVLTQFHPSKLYLKHINPGTSLVVQGLRIRLPMQGTWVRALVQEDSTCCGATKLMRHNSWACVLEPTSHNYWSPCALQPVLCNKRSHCNEKPTRHNEE